MSKHSIRQQMLCKRCELGADERDRAGNIIQQLLLVHQLFAAAEVVALYAPIRGEVATSLLFAAAVAAGKTVVYPRVAGNTMDFVMVSDFASLQLGAFSVLEPNGCEIVAADRLDLVVVPGVAFDRCGCRLGYGKGYYDRAFSNIARNQRNCALVGLGYDCQLVAQLPREDHDIVLDWLITDREMLLFDNTSC